MKMKMKGRAVVVGGSIAGLSCAHALISAAAWEVVVLEKTTSPPTGHSTGAGLGLEPLAQNLIKSWLKQPHLLDLCTIPLSIDQNGATDVQNGITRILSRDEDFNFRAAYWSDLHRLLHQALPEGTVRWGHMFLSFSDSDGADRVTVKAKALHTGDVYEVVADLLVAADGCLSSIRRSLYPDLKLRYSGYCAWRGVFDFSDNNSDTFLDLKKVYPDLGKCLYFDLASTTHSVFYELLNKRINWIWYINQPEPRLEGTSVTMKASSDMISEMKQEAGRYWVAELVKVMRETKEPFLNVIYDIEPLDRMTSGRVVLVGDAAHPTTPHGLRSTNMSVSDAAALGKCVAKWGVENLVSALEEYEFHRVPVVSEQVLFSRQLGRMKQGLELDDGTRFDPLSGTDCEKLQQKNMPFLSEVPLI
ncbi:monooxygenase family protein, partial [Genlisea aurea]